MSARNASTAALALLAALLCQGCAVMTVDVDVYKGPLANHRDVQMQQVAELAAAAKPILGRLRYTLEWYERQRMITRSVDDAVNLRWATGTASSPGPKPDPQVAASAQAALPLAPLADLKASNEWHEGSFLSPKARLVNRILSDYCDPVEIQFMLRDDSDTWPVMRDRFEQYKKTQCAPNAAQSYDARAAARGREFGIEILTRLYLRAKRRADEADAHTGTVTTSPPDPKFIPEAGRLYDALVRFSERILFVVNNDVLFGEHQGIVDTVWIGAVVHIWGGPDETCYVRVLQSIGNSVLFGVDEIRQQFQHDKSAVAAGPREASARDYVYHRVPFQVLEEMVGYLNVRRRDAEGAVARARADVTQANATAARIGNTLPAPAAGTDAATIAGEADTISGEAKTATDKADDVAKQVSKFITLGDLEGARAAGKKAQEDAASAAAKATKVKAKVPALQAKAAKAQADAQEKAKGAKDDAAAKAAATDLAKAVADARDADAAEAHAEAAQAQADAAVAHAKLAMAEADKALYARAYEAVVKFGLGLLENKVDPDTYPTPEQTYLEIVRKLEAEKKPPQAAAGLAGLLGVQKAAPRVLTVGEAECALDALKGYKAQRAPMVATTPPAQQPPQTAKDVVDGVIAVLRQDHIDAVHRFGEGSPEAKNAAAALEVAYGHRADMIYIRPPSAYLRTSFPSTTLQRDASLGWKNMLTEQQLRQIPFYDAFQDKQYYRTLQELDKQYWQNINTIRVAGGGRTNYVLVKDDVGNWYIKNFSGNPEDIIKSAQNLALFSMGPAVGSANLLAAKAKDATDKNLAAATQPTAQSQQFANEQSRYDSATAQDEKDVMNDVKDLPAAVQAAWDKDTSLAQYKDKLAAALKAQKELHLDGLSAPASNSNGQTAGKTSAAARSPSDHILDALQEVRRFHNGLTQAIAGAIPASTDSSAAVKAAQTEMSAVVAQKLRKHLSERQTVLGRYATAVEIIGEGGATKN